MHNNIPIKFATFSDRVVNHSKDPKDLVQAGDVVKYKSKGLRSIYIAEVRKYTDARSNKELLLVRGYSLENVEILEILTKEQFKQNSYKVVE